MSTGLTFGTISAAYGLSSGIIDQAQFSVLVCVVVLTAVVPTAIAQRFFTPHHATPTTGQDADSIGESDTPASPPRRRGH